MDHFVKRWPPQLLVPDTMPHFPLIDLGEWELSHCWLYGAPFHNFDQRAVLAVTLLHELMKWHLNECFVLFLVMSGSCEYFVHR